MEQLGERSDQLLADFLSSVSCFSSEAGAVEVAVERAAAALGADVAAIVRDEAVVSAFGCHDGGMWEPELVRAVTEELATVALPGFGPCAVASHPLGDPAPSFLVVARCGEGFSLDELALVRAMAQVLSLTLRMLRTLADERTARERSDLQAAENARLVASLQERQALFERLFRIQRSISHRAPINEVLDAITEGAAVLLGDDVVGIRLIDPEDPASVILVASRGMSPELTQSIRRGPISDGVGAMAITSRQLVVTHDYARLVRPLRTLVADGLQTAMAAPVFQDGDPIGSLVVASYDRARRYGGAEQEVLLAFAEHASIALNDASAVDVMRQAFADAVDRAHHDTLTGLPNRALVLERLAEAIACARGQHASVGVLFVDLDRFKVVNDTLGHAAGDEVLIRIGQRLRAAVRPQDTVGRLAGDEFVVVCQDVGRRVLVEVAERISRAIDVPLQLDGRDAVITASIGVALASPDRCAEDVLRDADSAMYQAKQRGRGRVELFDSAIRDRLLARVDTEQALRGVLARSELRLHYQPIVRAADGHLLAVEALVRWAHPGRGLMTPTDFVPLAEESSLILQLGRWVLREACAQLGRWQTVSPHLGHLQVGVNLSTRQFADPDIVPIAAEAIAQAGIAAQQLSLEITESALMEEVETTTGTLRALKDLGVRLSIDDFGTGYSSLSYLKRFPVDVLKIDRSFVNGLGNDPEDQEIVHAVVSMAHALGLEVVGEGVETDAQLDELRRLDCDAAQGFLIGLPLPAESDGPSRRPAPSRITRT